MEAEYAPMTDAVIVTFTKDETWLLGELMFVCLHLGLPPDVRAFISDLSGAIAKAVEPEL